MYLYIKIHILVKNYISLLISSLALVVFFSCADTQVDNNIRVLVKGSVTDQNNVPIADAYISVKTDANAQGASTVLLAEGFSDDLGAFQITSLFGSNDLFFIDVEFENQYSTYTYKTSTLNFRPDDLIFDLQTIQLKKISRFTINIDRESGPTNILEFSFNYLEPNCFQTYDEGVLNEMETFCFEERTFSRTLNDDNPILENRRLFLPLGSVVEFRYSINQEPEQVEIVTVDTEDYEFTFSY